MKQVIINADDFGMSEAFNYGVIKAYTTGVVSSTTIMVNMDTAKHAIDLAKNYPDLFIGQHTNFVLGKPCADPSKIPFLVDSNGFFYRSSEYRTGKRSFIYDEVKIETIAQMEKFKELTGHYPEHIEGHAVPSEVIDQVFLDVAKEFGIHTSIFSEKSKEVNLIGYKKVKALVSHKYMDIIESGTKVENFINDDFGILSGKGEEVAELHFHPGYIDQFILDHSSLTLPRCRDLSTLCDDKVKNWLKDNNIELISFGDLKL